MKQIFQKKKLNEEALTIIDHCTLIANSYQRQGYRLSLRQLYYQLVARNIVPNTEKSYNKVGCILVDARLAGLFDWDMIEDRNRSTLTVPHWNNPGEIIDSAAHSYRIDKWKDQPNWCQVMVEKQALEGILEPVCRQLDIPFTSNKGYSSVTMMHGTGQMIKRIFKERCKSQSLWRNAWTQRLDCAQYLQQNGLASGNDEEGTFRLTNKGTEEGWPRIVVFYLGDHDPSGIDMTRDVAERLRMFSDYTPIEVRRLALNIGQVRQLNPPENPAKLSDSRANKYIEKFGRSSWELDAVEPRELAEMVRRGVASVRDEGLWHAAMLKENKQRETLKKISEQLTKKEMEGE